ncbi:EscU/YscU/HrcU family type III secretion system export apparatus switch protein [Bacillus sp. F19]|nr:EscU/YscU/HrcU family type III secretion system export apparatus switch protein [Bacillus sp. F19]
MIDLHIQNCIMTVTIYNQFKPFHSLFHKEAAKFNHVPVQQDPSFNEILHKVEVNEQIPKELYHAVAEIFLFIYHVDKEVKTMSDKNNWEN